MFGCFFFFKKKKKYLFWPYLLNNLLGVISYFVGFRGGKASVFFVFGGFSLCCLFCLFVILTWEGEEVWLFLYL